MMKKSKSQRKFVNSMRAMEDVPTPARRFKYPPTFASVDSGRSALLGTCKRPVAETTVREGKLRRKRKVEVRCGGKVYVKRGTLARRRVYCEGCRARKAQRKLALRFEQRFAKLSPREQRREERKTMKLLQRFRRAGAR